MRLLVLLVAAAACSSKPAAPPAQKTPGADATAKVSLEQLISTDTVSVMRQPGDEMFVLRYTDELVVGLAGGSGAPTCWKQLVNRVKTGYQLSFERNDAYFIIEGDVAPAEVVSCLKTATHDGIVGTQQGELYAFETPAGTVYAAWRAPYVVIGTRSQVEGALRTPTADSAARWRALLAPLASAPTSMVRIDHMIDDIVGKNTTSYVFAMDRMEKTPRPLFAGRFIVHYATPADAEAGERWIREWSGRGQFPRRVDDARVMEHFDSLAAGVQKTKITRSGTTLEIAFDSDMFGGAEAMAAALSKLGASQ